MNYYIYLSKNKYYFNNINQLAEVLVCNPKMLGIEWLYAMPSHEPHYSVPRLMIKKSNDDIIDTGMCIYKSSEPFQITKPELERLGFTLFDLLPLVVAKSLINLTNINLNNLC